MCKDNQRLKDGLANMFAQGQISLDTFREAIRHINETGQLEYDQEFMKIDGHEG